MPNLNKSSLNCICPVFTNNLSRSNQLFFLYNKHTYIHVCLCVYSNAQKRLQEPNTSLKHRENQQKRAGLPYVHCYNSIPLPDGNQSSDGNQLVRNKHPTLPSPRDTTVESRGHSLPRRQSECFLAVNSSPLLQASCWLPQWPRECWFWLQMWEGWSAEKGEEEEECKVASRSSQPQQRRRGH